MVPLPPEVGLVLGIIDKILELSIVIAKDMPPEMRRAHWERVQKDLEWWQGAIDKVQDAFKVNG